MNTIEYSVFRPLADARAAAVIVHGMAEHRMRYERFADFLRDDGIGVITYDLPGHGKNAQEKGYFGKTGGWDLLVNSVESAVRKAMKEFPGVPVILFGHSMGSMLCRCWLQNHDQEIAGLILSGAPCWQKAGKAGIAVGKILRTFKGRKGHSALMDQLVTGNFNKSVKNPQSPVDWISYRRENVEEYLKDDLCGFGFTINGYIDELSGMEQMHDVRLYRCRKPKLPIAFFAGEDDPCIGGEEGWKDSIDTLKRAGYTDISDRRYPNMRHEILNEGRRKEVYADILNWINQVLVMKNS